MVGQVPQRADDSPTSLAATTNLAKTQWNTVAWECERREGLSRLSLRNLFHGWANSH
jgi:hypothetical protein